MQVCSISKAAAFAALPPPWPQDPLPALRAALAARPHKLVVLDDDPTGTQTVHDLTVVTEWSIATLAAELSAARDGFYILTNSRSLTPAATAALHRELAAQLHTAAVQTGVDFTVVSRSDSTLRGHFPLETDTLAAALGPIAVTLLAPYFEAGGRHTLGGVHYVAEGDRLVPAGETSFARDASFGYTASDLRAWVEEKSAGRVRATEVAHLSLPLIRSGGPEAVAAALRALPAGRVCITDAVAPRDIEVVALGALLAESPARRLLYRTAASFVAARLGLAPRPLLTAAELCAPASRLGGLVVVGSYVPKTTAQLRALRDSRPHRLVELSVPAVLDPARRDAAVADATGRVNDLLRAGHLVVLATSRELVTGSTPDESIAIVNTVSAALIDAVRGLRERPSFLIAKGGITSSDVATRALGVRRALVRGQLLPGVPVWRLGPESKFPGLDYVVFPGNVGGDTALVEAVDRFQPDPA